MSARRKIARSWKSVVAAVIALLLACGLATPAPASAADVLTWTTTPAAAANTWYGITYGKGLFVAVAQSGTGNRVMTSPDGVSWTARTSSTDNNWVSVTYGNGTFVAVARTGTGNRVMTSTDGISWTTRTSAADLLWSSVTYGNGLFVAVSSTYTQPTPTTNYVMTSPDGITWTSRSLPSAANQQWTNVTYGGGQFVAVAQTGTDRVMTSPDGITWTVRPSGGANWQSVTYGNGRYVAVAGSALDATTKAMWSTDGATWTVGTTPNNTNNWNSITYGGGLFVAVSFSGTGNRVMTSSDGATFTTNSNPVDSGWYALTFAKDATNANASVQNGLFVAIAGSGAGNRVMLSTAPAPPAYTVTSGTPTGGTQTATDANSDGTWDLVATPDEGYVFTGWSCDASQTPASSSSATTTVTPTADTTCTASFAPASTYYVTAGTATGGTTTATDLGSGTWSLSATPDTGYRFSGWSCDNLQTPDSSTAASTTIVPSADTTCTPTFVATYTVTAGTATGGTASATDNGDGTWSLTATPDTGYTFSGWSCDASQTPAASSSATTTLTPTADTTCTPSFSAIPTFTVTAGTATGGSATATDSTGDGTWDLVATADPGYAFSGWSCDASQSPDSTSAATTTIAPTADTTCTPSFTAYSVTAGTATGGTATATDTDGDGTWSLEAAPSAGYGFSGWSCDASQSPASTSSATTTVTPTADTTCTPTFTAYTVTAGTATGGTATATDTDGDGTWSLEATPSAGYGFSGWSCDASQSPASTSSSTTTLTPTADTTCTPTFVALPTLYVVPDNKTVTYGSQVPTYSFRYYSDAAHTTEVTPSVTAAPTCSSTLPYSTTTSAGTFAADITCTGGSDASYVFDDSATATLTVLPATMSCTVKGYTVTYDANPHTASVKCTGNGGATVTGLVVSGTTHTNVFSGSDLYTVTDPSGNYANVTGSVTDVVNPLATNLTYTGTQWVATSGTSMTPSASGLPGICTGALTYTLDVNPVTGAGGPYTLSVVNGTVSTTGWAPGAYLITASYAGDGNCAASFDMSGLTVGLTSPGSAWGGGYLNYTPGRGNFGFEVQTFAKTATTPSYVKGQLAWVMKNNWKFKGTLTSYSVNSITGVGTAKGTGNLFYWTKSGTGGNWVAATSGAASVTITFTQTTPSTKTKGGSVGSFGIAFGGTKAASSPTLPSYSIQNINYGNIKMN